MNFFLKYLGSGFSLITLNQTLPYTANAQTIGIKVMSKQTVSSEAVWSESTLFAIPFASFGAHYHYMILSL